MNSSVDAHESANRPPHVAAVITNIVPYHSARWSAFADRSNYQTSLIEVTNFDPFAVLAYNQVSPRISKHTLFDHRIGGKADIRKVDVAINSLLTQLAPDVVVLSGYSLYHALIALKWATKHRKHTVLCSESSEHDEPRQPAKEFIKSQLVRMASAALVGGDTHAKYLSRLGLGSDKIHLGYDVVDNHHFAANSSAPSTRYQNKEQPRTFLMCSRFTEKKNLKFAIQAFGQYVQACQQSGIAPWRLRILGSGPLKESLLDCVTSLGLTTLVQFPGAVGYADLPREYGAAHAFVHASKIEQWGLVVNEAMAAGLPVIVSNRCGCVSELVQASNGICFDPFDLDALCQALLTFTRLEHQELSAMSRSSLEIVGSWSPERFTDGLLGAISNCRARPWHPPTFIQRISLELAIFKSLTQTSGV